MSFVADSRSAGYTYCAIAALSMLHRLPSSKPPPPRPGLTHVNATIRWLLSRQHSYSDGDDGDDEQAPRSLQQQIKLAGVYEEEPLVPGLSTQELEFVGFNGRCNKRVDTCYAFWVAASLEVRASSAAPLPE